LDYKMVGLSKLQSYNNSLNMATATPNYFHDKEATAIV